MAITPTDDYLKDYYQNALEGFRRNYEIAPIWLVGGIAQNQPNKKMSILKLTEGNENIVYADPNDYFAHFKVMSGGSLQDWGLAEYPFASMAMAANAVLQNPLKVSLIMYCPAQTNQNTYTAKSATITSLKYALDNHITNGGYFEVQTPAFTYSNCLLVSLRDITVQGDKQVQSMYQWDFSAPLILPSQTENVMNNLYQKLTQQLPVSVNAEGGIDQSGSTAVTNIPNTQVSGSTTTVSY